MAKAKPEVPSCESLGFDENRRCKYCGSAHPDDFMDAINNHKTVLGTTDKNYKVYVTNLPSIKFYFHHLSDEQMKRFVDIYNSQQIKYSLDIPFYVLPFFMRSL